MVVVKRCRISYFTSTTFGSTGATYVHVISLGMDHRATDYVNTVVLDGEDEVSVRLMWINYRTLYNDLMMDEKAIGHMHS